MPIAIAANPGSKTDFGPIEWIGNQLGIQARLPPSLSKTGIQSAERRRKNFAQRVDHAATLGGDVGFFEEDFPGAPQAFQHDLELLAQCLALGWRQQRILASQKQSVESAVLLENRRSLRFGGMRGENRFDANGRQRSRDAGAIDSSRREFLQLAGPQPRFGRTSLIHLAQAPRRGGCIFLDHIEELKCHGGCLLKAFAGLGILASPRQAFRHSLLPQFAQDLIKTPEEKVEVGGNFIETL